MSDWGATHSTSLPAGLDMEMPDGRYLNPSKVVDGMRQGNISEARVDNAVLRILIPMFAVGVMDAEPGAWDASKHSVNASTRSPKFDFKIREQICFFTGFCSCVFINFPLFFSHRQVLVDISAIFS